jgi:hypothetical protein
MMRRTRQLRFSVIRSLRTLVSLIYRGVSPISFKIPPRASRVQVNDVIGPHPLHWSGWIHLANHCGAKPLIVRTIFTRQKGQRPQQHAHVGDFGECCSARQFGYSCGRILVEGAPSPRIAQLIFCNDLTISGVYAIRLPTVGAEHQIVIVAIS